MTKQNDCLTVLPCAALQVVENTLDIRAKDIQEIKSDVKEIRTMLQELKSAEGLWGEVLTLKDDVESLKAKQKAFDENKNKSLWVVVTLFFTVLGAAIIKFLFK